jgi:hypothetical protein
MEFGIHKNYHRSGNSTVGPEGSFQKMRMTLFTETVIPDKYPDNDNSVF